MSTIQASSSKGPAIAVFREALEAFIVKKMVTTIQNVATLSLRFGADKENFADFASSIVIDSKVDLHDNVCIEADDNMPAHTFAHYWAMCRSYNAHAFSLSRTWNHNQLRATLDSTLNSRVKGQSCITTRCTWHLWTQWH